MHCRRPQPSAGPSPRASRTRRRSCPRWRASCVSSLAAPSVRRLLGDPVSRPWGGFFLVAVYARRTLTIARQIVELNEFVNRLLLAAILDALRHAAMQMVLQDQRLE